MQVWVSSYSSRDMQGHCQLDDEWSPQIRLSSFEVASSICRNRQVPWKATRSLRSSVDICTWKSWHGHIPLRTRQIWAISSCRLRLCWLNRPNAHFTRCHRSFPLGLLEHWSHPATSNAQWTYYRKSIKHAFRSVHCYNSRWRSITLLTNVRNPAPEKALVTGDRMHRWEFDISWKGRTFVDT